MRDILIAILALFATGFISSSKSKLSEEAATEKVESAVINDQSEKLELPDLYKGMADDPSNRLGGLDVGDTAPAIETTLIDGASFNMKQKLKEGPVAIVFYRGYWCGVCTKHLAALTEHAAELKERNLSIFTITPESKEFIEKTIEKTKMNFPVIHDADLSIMNDYKVAYQVTSDYAEKVEGFTDVSLAATQGQEQAYLPVPATFLISQEGKIHYAHYDHNYGKRATAEDLLEALKTL